MFCTGAGKRDCFLTAIVSVNGSDISRVRL